MCLHPQVQLIRKPLPLTLGEILQINVRLPRHQLVLREVRLSLYIKETGVLSCLVFILVTVVAVILDVSFKDT